MSERYFVAPPVSGERAALTDGEAHHAIHVMRVGPGTEVVLFDGSGAEFEARVDRVGRKEVELVVVSRREVDRELPFELVLGVALPKGERQRWLVEKAVELGVGRIVPLVTSRSVARPTPGALTRLRRTVIEASKQCGRNRLATIDNPLDWTEFVAQPQDAHRRLLAHPDAGRDQKKLPTATIDEPGPVTLAIGPEGGFTDDEVALAATAGWQTVDLGSRTLRIETAAVFMISVVAGQLR